MEFIGKKEKEVLSATADLGALASEYASALLASQPPNVEFDQRGNARKKAGKKAPRLGGNFAALSAAVVVANKELQELPQIPPQEVPQEAQALLKNELKRHKQIKSKNKTPQDKKDIAECKKLLN